ncbi:hypothetical protein LTR94_011455, partial [Friedmanniomyces endolithicus]
HQIKRLLPARVLLSQRPHFFGRAHRNPRQSYDLPLAVERALPSHHQIFKTFIDRMEQQGLDLSRSSISRACYVLLGMKYYSKTKTVWGG